MDIEKQIYELSADTLAFSTILARVLGNIADTSPKMHAAVAGGFNDAASFIEHIAIMHGTNASPLQTVKALQIVEELRAATLGDQDKPKHVV